MKKDALAGMKVLLTREKEDNSQLRTELEARGAIVIEIPAITTRALEPANADEAFMKWADFKWTVFTSRKSAGLFFSWIRDKGRPFPPNSLTAAVGKGTSKVLQEHGCKVDLVPGTEDGKSLGEALSKGSPPCLSLFPQAKGAQGSARAILEASSWKIFELELYETVPSRLLESRLSALERGADLAFFASPSALIGFKANPKAFSLISNMAILPIGMTTFKEAREMGLKTLPPPRETSIESILREMEDYRSAQAP